MYTAFTKEIDGLTVILGLDKERLDPMRTNIKIKPLIENSTEFKAKKGRLEKIKSLTTANDSLFRQGRKITNRVALAKGKLLNELNNEDFTSGEQNSLNGYNSKMVANNSEIETCNGELCECEKNLKKKVAELQRSNGVFFELTNEYENQITDKTHEEFSGKLEQIKNKKMFLLSDGSIVNDNRNKVFYGLVDGLWVKKEIKLLSEEIDSSFKLFEDLSEEEKAEMNVQFETDRITGLSAEEKEAEKLSLCNQALNQAGKMRNELEIVGEELALVKAQDFYNSEVARISGIY